MNEKILERIVFALGGAMVTVVVYAMDWQRDQDDHIAKLKEISVQQTTILQMQTQYQERALTPAASSPVFLSPVPEAPAFRLSPPITNPPHEEPPQ